VPLDIAASRFLPALLVNLVLGALAWRAGAVRPSGFAAGVLLGTCIYVALGWPGFLVLAAFFVLGSALTRIGYARKRELGTAEGRAGARGAAHAVANAGFPTLFALAALGTGVPLWTLAFVAAFATASMDTAGSEIGPLLGRRTVSLRNLKAVPPGTEGAVSLEGTLAGLLAAFLVGGVGALSGLIPPMQLGAIVLGAAAGNLYEGLLGARGVLSHGWLNATNTLVGAGIAVLLGAFCF
jgi:uncharacterized protein (TIGR00297 family)